MREWAVSCAGRTVSPRGARCPRAVPLTPSVLGELVCPGGPTHTVSSGGAGVSRRSHSHCQSWGSQVCLGSPAHTVGTGGAGVPGRSRSRCGLSFQACRYGHVQHLEHLLFYGADMGAQNASGNTALHICALYNQVSEP